MAGGAGPIRLALVDDYEVVLVGVAKMFEQYEDRVIVVDMSTGDEVAEPVDLVLFDTFAQHEADSNDITVLVDSGRAAAVAVYTWSFDEALIAAALAQGARGYLSKTLTAADLVSAIERIHDGEVVISTAPPVRARATVGLDWPGRAEGLTEREAEVIALVTQAKSNAEIAQITYLSLNTVKTYLRNAFRKIGVRSRTEAAVWGLSHGFGVESHRIDQWRRTS